MNRKLQDTVLEEIGFKEISDNTVLDDYALSQNFHTKIDNVYLPRLDKYPFKLVRFTQTKRAGKNTVIIQ
ncbi:MAG: hypothetical protein Q8P90_02670 [bacterium]|nr:hypothetical protein [bacterium]